MQKKTKEQLFILKFRKLFKEKMGELKYILYAEDNSNDIELTLEAFKDIKIANRVQVVNDGAQVLDFLYKRGKFKIRTGANPIVILLDIKMPKIDGFQALKIIKEDPEFRNIPVVILTSSREEKDLVESYKMNTNAYVVKPMDFDQFTKAIKELGVFWALINEPPPGSGKV